LSILGWRRRERCKISASKAECVLMIAIFHTSSLTRTILIEV
jgi:hypothetical protein